MELIDGAETREKRTETHTCDYISRQAAIDALRYAQHRFTVADEAGGMGTVKWSEDVIYFAAAERALNDLPSAQPELLPDGTLIVDTGRYREVRRVLVMHGTEGTLYYADGDIVYCRECKWQNKGANGAETWNLCGYRSWQYTPIDDEHYCSWGERREDDTDD